VKDKPSQREVNDMAGLIEKNGLAEKVLCLSATKSARDIEAILLAEDGVTISYRSIANFVKDVRQERAEATRALVQEHIKATVPTDLETLDMLINREREWFNDEGLKVSEKLMVAKELRQTIDTKLKYSGAGEMGDQVVTIKLPEELEEC
jgi:hypothetical protein